LGGIGKVSVCGSGCGRLVAVAGGINTGGGYIGSDRVAVAGWQ
jgi:hypothetical protein